MASASDRTAADQRARVRFLCQRYPRHCPLLGPLSFSAALTLSPVLACRSFHNL